MRDCRKIASREKHGSKTITGKLHPVCIRMQVLLRILLSGRYDILFVLLQGHKRATRFPRASIGHMRVFSRNVFE